MNNLYIIYLKPILCLHLRLQAAIYHEVTQEIQKSTIQHRDAALLLYI